MKALGNGKYEITNKKTGKTKIVSEQELSQYGLSTPSSEASGVKGIARGGSNLLRAFGLGILPNLAADVTDIGARFTRGKPTSYEDLDYNPFRSPEQAERKYPKLFDQDKNLLSQATQGYGQVGKDSVGAASYALGGSGIGMNALRGGMIGTAQDDANPASVSMNATLGGLIGPLLGLLAHPMKPLINTVDDILAASSKKVDMNKILGSLKSGKVPKPMQKYPSKDALSALDEVANVDLPTRMNQLRTFPKVQNVDPTVPNEILNTIPGPLNMNQIPISTANNLKRQMWGVGYGSSNKAYNQASKEAGRLLKEEIEMLEPSVVGPNRMLSLMNSVPNFINKTNRLLPFKIGAVNNAISSPVIGGVQKAIPSGGGYLNQLFPLLYNLERQSRPTEDRQGGY